MVFLEFLLCLVCSVINVISKEINFFVGLEDSKATCVVAGSDHSASLTGGYPLFQVNVPSRIL